MKNNHERVVAYFRQYRARNRTKCRAWDRKFKEGNVERLKRERHENYLLHKEEYAEAGRERQQGYKRFIVETLGGKCICCGETDLAFLTLEHIHKDGQAHRATKKNIYCDVIRQGVPKDRYTVLCMNCNYATRYNHVCPHQLKRSLEVLG